MFHDARGQLGEEANGDNGPVQGDDDDERWEDVEENEEEEEEEGE